MPNNQASPSASQPPPPSSPSLVLFGIAIISGIGAGVLFPKSEYPIIYGIFRFCAQAFLALIKGIIVPLIFSTLVVGIAQVGDIKAVGRMGVRALIYFEVVTTIALLIGWVVAIIFRPGEGLPLDTSVSSSMHASNHFNLWETLLHLFPSNLAQHWVQGELLPIVVFAVLFGVSIAKIQEKSSILIEFFEAVAQAMFKYTHMVMRLVPVGTFGAMAYNISHMASGYCLTGGPVESCQDAARLEGLSAVFHILGQYAKLVGTLYLALAVLCITVFCPLLIISKIPLSLFLRIIRTPALTAFLTASSEAALPHLLEELVRSGVPRRVASFILPAGYSFNLDGSTLYLVLASMAIAQAAGIEQSLGQQFLMLFTFMITSKGVAGVPRATLVIIAGTCTSFGLPGEAGVSMLLAVDALMDMARTATNVVGNALATLLITRWEGAHEDQVTHAS
ncbi:MAG: dicarboxylate/amino acid:cation symporter [Sandaracinaceae bacterium]|nr:dicarboxylate/amino acid:cation symporter [Sandaracinaceae bacterium]